MAAERAMEAIRARGFTRFDRGGLYCLFLCLPGVDVSNTVADEMWLAWSILLPVACEDRDGQLQRLSRKIPSRACARVGTGDPNPHITIIVILDTYM